MQFIIDDLRSFETKLKPPFMLTGIVGCCYSVLSKELFYLALDKHRATNQLSYHYHYSCPYSYYQPVLSYIAYFMNSL